MDANPLATIYPNPLHPKNVAIQLLRAKFGGMIPEMVTWMECLELMEKFALQESLIAEEWRRLAQDKINREIPMFSIKP